VSLELNKQRCLGMLNFSLAILVGL